MSTGPLTIAVPKGRILKPLSILLARAGVDTGALLADDRTLIRAASPDLRFLLLKPDDVPTYVEYGAADLGVCGRDVLDERASEVYRPLDLGIGRCRMVVAGLAKARTPEHLDATPHGSLPRVATKYPRTAAAHFARRGVQAEVVYVQGSVELAPLTGLADLIVDLVETGTTLVQNGLEEKEDVAQVSSVLVANRASFKLRHAAIAPLLERLRAAIPPAA
ncbi:MAG TPA: ATP phosphoribosyltransferase [Polyangiaceae bacterium]